MCSCKNKPHNNQKTPFKKTALKPPSIKSTLTYNIHQLKSLKQQNVYK